ncbi:Uncharacterised protein [uncultured archaeon]|nr:Uncharacterised protein [uncultured archaeon]
MLKKRLNVLFICVCLLLLFSMTASARQLSVKKVVQNTDVKTGDSVSIALEFENPFKTSIPVTIQDNNVLGNNGLDIQCYEYTLPDKPVMTLSYDFPIQAFSSGDFTLDTASVTYTNPDTGSQETIQSQPLQITIKQGTSSGQQQGITSIYKCKGVSMQSTSYSSGSSTSISINSGQHQVNTPPPQQPDNVQQTASDMQNLKDEMNRQQQDYKNMQDELKRRIENNSDFKRMREELEKQGYSQQQEDIKSESNDSGTFDYRFGKGNESANITGRMNASRMEAISKESSEDIKKLQQYIERNATYQQMNKTLSDKGYNLTDKKIDTKSNISSFDYSFNDSQGRIASISGNVTHEGTIKDISLKEPQEPLPYWMMIFLVLPLLGVYLYKKYRTGAGIPPAQTPVPVKTDHREEALARLEAAVRMFNGGMQKEAYSEASCAVKIYFKGTLGINELTSEEIVNTVRESNNRARVEDVKQCLMLCDLVKFARYEPNPDDFNRAVEYARRVII